MVLFQQIARTLRAFPVAAWLKQRSLSPAAILLAGFALRLAYFLQVKDAFLFGRPFLDAEFYHRWAIEVAAGDWLGVKRGVFMMSPGYSYFLAGIYALFGVSVKAAVFVQILLGVACGWMILVLGSRHLSREAGLLGAAAYLLYAPEILYESLLLKTVLINAVTTGALLAASGAHPAGWLLSGFLTGCSSHLRPTALLLAPVLGFWLWHRSPRRVLAPSIFAAGLLMALAPVAFRNYLVGGEWVWTTAHGGMNFYTGNSPAGRGPYQELPFARSDPAFEQDDFLLEARRRSGQNLTPAQSSRFWYAEAWRFIRAEPLREGVLLLKKAVIFFNGYEPPININLEFLRAEFGSVAALPLVSFPALLALALPGLARAAPNPLLLGYLAVIFLSNVAFFVSSEYRFPAVPVLCLYAGWAVHRTVLAVRGRSLKRVALFSAAFAVFFAAASTDIYEKVLNMPGYRQRLAGNSLYSLGLEYQEAGKLDEAIAAYRESLRLRPGDALTHNNLGIVLATRGRPVEAAEHFEKAVRGFPAAYENLGRVLATLGRYREAAESYRQAQRLQRARPGGE